MRLVLLLVAGCTATSVTQQSGIDPMECTETLPGSTIGWIGDAQITFVTTGDVFSTTFSNTAITGASHGTISYVGAGSLTLITSNDAIDAACVGKLVTYTYAWSDDCKEVGLSRDADECELRVYNLDGATLRQK